MKSLIVIQCEQLTEAQSQALILIINMPGSSHGIYSPSCQLPSGAHAEPIDTAEALHTLAVEAENLVMFAPVGAVVEDKLIASYLGARAKRVCWVHDDGIYRDAPLRKEAARKPNMLFVFPGSIVPLNLGSHQRAFNLLRNLQSCGHIVDVLIPRSANQERVASALRCYADNVYFYKNTKRKYRGPQRWMRGIDKRWRQLRGLGTNLPDLYSERAKNKPVDSVARMANSLYLAKEYAVVLVSYAWMMDSLRHLKPFRDKFKVVCDTHDVQFHRNRTEMGRWGRLCSHTARQKKLELKHLRQADAILAISESDQKMLKATLPKSRVSQVSPGFDYATSKLKRRPTQSPVNFGFIGGAMAANVQAVAYIIEHWWPAIQKFSPDSKLYLAGSVSNNDQIRQMTFFDESIVRLGFVDNLAEFYRQIDASLNPVMVAGGLNFKSVEAVFYGKHLLTNSLGQKCLGVNFPCEVIHVAEQLNDVIRTIETDANADLSTRRDLQQLAVEQFGNSRACQDIISHLAFVA